MDEQVDKMCRLGKFQLRQIRTIRQCLTYDATVMLVMAFVDTQRDYGNSLLYRTSNKKLTKLKRVQNAAARLITGKKKYEHITPGASGPTTATCATTN